MSNEERHKRIDYLELSVTSPEALAKTRDFFNRVFGWEYQAWGDEYADTKSSGLPSGISALKDATPVPLPVVYVTNLEETLEEVRAAGAEITKPIFEFPGGRRFHFTEPSGNELAVWSEQT